MIKKDYWKLKLIIPSDNGEQALEIADNLIRSGAIDIIVIDSVVELKNLYGRIFKDLGKFKDSIKIYGQPRYP